MNPLPTPKAILFDLDDTILADTPHVDACWIDSIQEYRDELGTAADTLFDSILATRDWFWADPQRHRDGRLNLLQTRRDLATHALARVGVDNSSLAALVADRYSTLRHARTAPFDGAIAMLEVLHDRGLQLALITNGRADMQREKIARFDLARHFDSILVEGEFGCGKPDPRVYEHVLGALQLAPAQVWMIGDNLEWDVFAPMRMGITGIWHDVRKQGLPETAMQSPDRVVMRVADLLSLIEPLIEHRTF
jgi:putative hydrolase of the HAD superfamily